MDQAVRRLALELASHGIVVNAVVMPVVDRGSETVGRGALFLLAL
ncbi:hypothetical protein [Umezawaea sp. Da 62-37]|nr:hypothetical protein [Umezawaea sp. Da 62-37]WNV89003.1 hypothetical protein RM788_12070 [Umezawaea sp. Da 62-37]